MSGSSSSGITLVKMWKPGQSKLFSPRDISNILCFHIDNPEDCQLLLLFAHPGENVYNRIMIHCPLEQTWTIKMFLPEGDFYSFCSHWQSRAIASPLRPPWWKYLQPNNGTLSPIANLNNQNCSPRGIFLFPLFTLAMRGLPIAHSLRSPWWNCLHQNNGTLSPRANLDNQNCSPRGIFFIPFAHIGNPEDCQLLNLWAHSG